MRRWRTVSRLLRLAWPYRGWMLLAALLGALTIGSSIGLMSAAAWIIASAALHPPISALNLAIVGVRFFGITRGVFRYLERYVAHQATFRLLARLRVWFYAGVEPLVPAGLARHHSGDLLARVVADIETLQEFYLRVIAPPLIALLVGAGTVIFMALHDPRLALALTGFHWLAGAAVPLLTQTLARRAGDATIATRAALTAALVDGIQGMADLTAYGAQDRHRARVQALSRDLQTQQARTARIAALDNALGSLIISVATVTTLIIAIPLARSGDLDGVMLAALALATLSSFEGTLAIPAAFQHWRATQAAARRLFEIVDSPAQRKISGQDTLSSPAWGDQGPALCVSDLTFRYTPADPLALDRVSFELPPGGVAAVVGASGAGKSTLVNLLLRFWDADGGSITLGGRDLRALDPDAARAFFSVMPQGAHLFNATIRDNLLLANPAASDDDLWRALDAAQLRAFAEALPRGLDTWTGEQGLSLSGGERQRLALARVLLKDAPVLLLDEPTANLDTQTERAILDTIFTARGDRATLLITHRLVGLERADTIIALRAGQVVERGTHADLLRAGGYYRRLWDAQQGLIAPAETR